MNFVVGHPRSGTAYVAHLLNAGGRRVSEHEWLVKLSWGELKSLASRFYEGRCSAAKVQRLFKHYETTPAVEIDCNWKLTWVLPVLLEAFPEARVLHLTRDPRTNVVATYNLDYYGTAVSRLSRSAYREFRLKLPADSPPEDIGLEYDSLQGWYRSFPRLAVDGWESMSRLAKNAAFWWETHRLLLAALAGYPAKLRLKVEDLADTAAVERLLEFFGVSVPEAALDRARAVSINGKVFDKALARGLG